ncbi:HAMP domain-containing sensor histidine kinase [Sphingomonas sp. ZT3P38]|uniref:sensor histidine kinase n=1 Tax=Parasphingomonas zepuensis TaxID=3096161 RepID=UPI002FCCB4DA
MTLRFDDSLETVLAAETSTPLGAQSVWRQLVDLIARRHVPPGADAMARLRAIRLDVPLPVRAASARGAALADPPAALVQLFAEDEPGIATPVLRTAQLAGDEWIALLPDMPPSARAILRHRRDLPQAVVRALESFDSVGLTLPPREAQAVAEVVPFQPPLPEAVTGSFKVAELVARIDAYRRLREETPIAREIQPAPFERDSTWARSFRFETDEAGVVRWIEGASRAPLIGLSLSVAGSSGVDGAAAGAFRRRADFADARLVVEGESDAAGQWRITGVPVFDRATGRFTGYRGAARRPRADESAEPRASRHPASEALRQLVHELRTPTNAIAGFAEMIESQMLGPVPQAYRAHAADILGQASDLLTAIDDIDMAARIESNALELRPGQVRLAPLLERVAGDLAPLSALRGTAIDIHAGDGDLAIAGDDRAVERLIGRLMATLVAAGSRDERIGIVAKREAEGVVALIFDRPHALAAYAGDSLLTIDAETEADRDEAPLLGTGFALRLARNLAVELRGSLVLGDQVLTLRLPAALVDQVGQLSSS